MDGGKKKYTALMGMQEKDRHFLQVRHPRMLSPPNQRELLGGGLLQTYSQECDLLWGYLGSL